MRRFLFLTVLLAGLGTLFGIGGASAQPMSQSPVLLNLDLAAPAQSLAQDVTYRRGYSYCVWKKRCGYVQRCYYRNGYRYCSPVYVCKRYCERHYKLRKLYRLPHLYLRYGY